MSSTLFKFLHRQTCFAFCSGSVSTLNTIFPIRQHAMARTLSQVSVSLSNLRPARGSNKLRKRVGRGIANGGRFCGRGNAGQKSRSGPGIPRGFEGGQTPFHLTVPKRGHHNPHKLELSLISLDRIQHLINTERIDPGKPITMYELRRAGIKIDKDGAKIMARGAIYFSSNVVIEATQFTQAAISRIEELGGTAVSVYHNRRSLMHLLRPKSLHIHPSLPKPQLHPPMTFKKRLRYSEWERRGYLHPDVRAKLRLVDPTFESRYLMVDPVMPLDKPTLNFRNIPNELRQEGLLPK